MKVDAVAESINSYFSSVFTIKDYGNFPEYNNVVDVKLSVIHCDTNEATPNKSPGPDHIPPLVMKECAVEIAPFVYTLLNRSFSAGKVPHA